LDFVNGRSLVPLLHDHVPPVERWRKAILLEHGFIQTGDVGRTPADASDDVEPPDPFDLEVAQSQMPQPFQGVHTRNTSMWNTSARASVRCTIFMMTRTSRPASQPRRILIVSRAWPHGLTRFAPAPARLAARRKPRRLRRGARVAADSDRQRPKFENSRISFDNSSFPDGATTLRLGSGAGV
jgi:hypothetical protein